MIFLFERNKQTTSKKLVGDNKNIEHITKFDWAPGFEKGKKLKSIAGQTLEEKIGSVKINQRMDLKKDEVVS